MKSIRDGKEGIGRNKGNSGYRARISIFTLCSMLCAMFFLIFPSAGGSENITEVKDLRHWSTSGYTRVVIDLSATAEFAKGQLSEPERLFFDLKDSRLSKDCPRTFTVNDRLVKTVRLGQFSADTVRIVFDLVSPDYDFKVFNLEDPPRLVVDILPRKNSDENRGISEPEKTNADKKEIKTEAKLFLKKRIVIDPGHGGHDPGAVGPSGIYEKDVVLDIALKARDIIIKEYPEYEVILTRDRDIFLPLPERAKIANNNNADFFLSIHANASPNRRARGIETYLLNWTDDDEALQVAARENAISVNRMKQVQNELGFILASLERESKRDDSVKLAGYIQNSLVTGITSRYPQVNDLGVKQALFYVLVDAKMASALAEVSFISNPEEEGLLANDSYRHEIAYSLVSGIDAYFNNSAPRQKTAGLKPQQKTDYKKVSYKKEISSVKKYKTRHNKYSRRTR